MRCLRFIVLLSLLIFRMPRRGYTPHPASTAATLLDVFHPFDATFTDLGVHADAVALLVVVPGRTLV